MATEHAAETPESNMRETSLVDPVVMNQRQVDVAEQQHVSRDPGMLRRQRIRPHFPRNGPWREVLLLAGRLNLPRHIMCSSNVIHTVLWHALPHGAPRDWAPPQLGQVQMKPRHVSIHVTLDQYPIVHATTRLTLTEPLLCRHAHLFKFLLTPPHVANDRRRPLLNQRRQLRKGNMRFRHITHVHYRNVVKILIYATTIWDQHSHTARVSAL